MKQLFGQYLTAAGDGTGAYNANLDHSSAAVSYKITVPTGETYNLARMLIYIEDTTPMSITDYGKLTALTNGVSFTATIGGETIVFDGGVPVKTNGGYKALCYDQTIDSAGSGNDICAVRWTFTNYGGPLVLSEGDSFQAILNDNFTGLVAHTFFVEGIRYFGG